MTFSSIETPYHSIPQNTCYIPNLPSIPSTERILLLSAYLQLKSSLVGLDELITLLSKVIGDDRCFIGAEFQRLTAFMPTRPIWKGLIAIIRVGGGDK